MIQEQKNKLGFLIILLLILSSCLGQAESDKKCVKTEIEYVRVNKVYLTETHCVEWASEVTQTEQQP